MRRLSNVSQRQNVTVTQCSVISISFCLMDIFHYARQYSMDIFKFHTETSRVNAVVDDHWGNVIHIHAAKYLLKVVITSQFTTAH